MLSGEQGTMLLAVVTHAKVDRGTIFCGGQHHVGHAFGYVYSLRPGFFRLLPLFLSNLFSLVVLSDSILPLKHVPGFARQALPNSSCRSYLGGNVLDGPV